MKLSFEDWWAQHCVAGNPLMKTMARTAWLACEAALAASGTGCQHLWQCAKCDIIASGTEPMREQVEVLHSSDGADTPFCCESGQTYPCRTLALFRAPSECTLKCDCTTVAECRLRAPSEAKPGQGTMSDEEYAKSGGYMKSCGCLHKDGICKHDE